MRYESLLLTGLWAVLSEELNNNSWAGRPTPDGDVKIDAGLGGWRHGHIGDDYFRQVVRGWS